MDTPIWTPEFGHPRSDIRVDREGRKLRIKNPVIPPAVGAV
jgi:hypothetical protein